MHFNIGKIPNRKLICKIPIIEFIRVLLSFKKIILMFFIELLHIKHLKLINSSIEWGTEGALSFKMSSYTTSNS